MARSIGVIVSVVEPSSRDNRDYWYKPDTFEWYELNDGSGWVKIDQPDITLTMRVTFDGDVYAGDKKGSSEDVTIPGVGKLKFKKGIYTGFTPA